MQCPICGKKKIWKYGTRIGRKGKSRRFLCRTCGHIWEVLEESLKQKKVNSSGNISFPEELKNYFVDLMIKIIEDVERDVPIEKAGWCTFNEEVVKKLIKTGLCENGENGIRLVISSSRHFPNKLAWTDEGDIIIDIKRAVELNEILSKISDDPELLIGAEYAGLIRMLQTSNFPVLACILFKEGLNAEIWFIKAPASAYDLVFDLAKNLWGTKRAEESLKSLENFGLPIPKKENGEISDKIKKILNWSIVPEVFDSEILELLGFLWYVDYLMIQKKIKYLESTRIVQKNSWDIIELLYGKKIHGEKIQEVEENLLEANREIESLTMQNRGEEKSRVTDWHDVIRLPW